MKGPVTSTAPLLLLVLMTGCFHARRQTARIQPLAPPLVETPPPAPPPQVTTAPEPPRVAESTPEPAPEPTPGPEPKKHVRRHKPAPKDNAPPPAETADNSVPALGQISSGDPPDLRLQTQNSIKSIEQIRDFLNQAKKALTTGDVDGASTLAAKAKVLLAEVSR
jgi:outer membrane biosynthesis protein TonB